MLHFESNKGRRLNPKQKQILYSAMATNRKILDCIAGDSDVRRTRKAVWNRVARELNNVGPAKDITQWRKVWTDLRLGMRKKWEKAQRNQYILTEYERRVISACGMIEKPEDECSDEKSAEDINSFLDFLEDDLAKEHTSIHEYSDYSSHSQQQQYLDDSNEFIICQPTDINVKDEFDEDPNNYADFEEPSVYISDDEPATAFEECREPSVECISDDEEQITQSIKIESPDHMSYEEPDLKSTVPRPIPEETETVTVPRPIQIPIEKETVPQPILLQCIPEMLSVPSRSGLSNNINLTKRKKLKDPTLKEVKKMHRNLLRESKKQTALLKKLVQGMQN